MRGQVGFLGLLFLCSLLFFSGCKSAAEVRRPKPSSDIAEVSSEQKKAELLKRLERRFEDPDAQFQLGQLYHADGLWSQAQWRYNQALSFEPAHRDSQAALVKLHLDSGDAAKSKLSADIYMNQVCGSAKESLRLGLAFQKQELDDYALACYRQALNLAPNSAKVHRQIGYYYLSKNDKERAKDYLTRSFQLNPNQPEVAGELGRLGIAVRIPRKQQLENSKKLDRIVEQSEKK
ncbi:MAG: hypothetical protein JXB29_09460 [Sedimentisphaerales bacterium]|nr:hypothetical protein [Sedimentisphaerales bacterium]